jgi:hypothetical protein
MLAQMMADLGRSNPQLAMLAQIMQSRAPVSQSGDAGANSAAEEEIASLTAQLDEMRVRLDTTQRQMRRLLDAHRAATDRIADLAAALGACGLCWGEDAACPNCRGRGRAGMVRPDSELRARLLGPPKPATAKSNSTV